MTNEIILVEQLHHNNDHNTPKNGKTILESGMVLF